MAAEKGVNNIPISDMSPATKLVNITANDTTDLTALKIRSLYIGSAGDVRIIAWNDTNPITFAAVPAGFIIPVMVKKVMLTGTTSPSIVGMI